jgi:hypothetical protein
MVISVALSLVLTMVSKFLLARHLLSRGALFAIMPDWGVLSVGCLFYGMITAELIFKLFRPKKKGKKAKKKGIPYILEWETGKRAHKDNIEITGILPHLFFLAVFIGSIAILVGAFYEYTLFTDEGITACFWDEIVERQHSYEQIEEVYLSAGRIRVDHKECFPHRNVYVIKLPDGEIVGGDKNHESHGGSPEEIIHHLLDSGVPFGGSFVERPWEEPITFEELEEMGLEPFRPALIPTSENFRMCERLFEMGRASLDKYSEYAASVNSTGETQA